MTVSGSPPAKRSSAPGSNPAPRFDAKLLGRRRVLRDGAPRLLRMREVSNGIKKEPHSEEPAQRASRTTHGAGSTGVHMKPVELNDRQYHLPTRPTVVICADGCDPSYLEAGFAAGVLPTIAKWRDSGFYALADAV